jgi:hypothetical protein
MTQDLNEVLQEFQDYIETHQDRPSPTVLRELIRRAYERAYEAGEKSSPTVERRLAILEPLIEDMEKTAHAAGVASERERMKKWADQAKCDPGDIVTGWVVHLPALLQTLNNLP